MSHLDKCEARTNVEISKKEKKGPIHDNLSQFSSSSRNRLSYEGV